MVANSSGPLLLLKMDLMKSYQPLSHAGTYFTYVAPRKRNASVKRKDRSAKVSEWECERHVTAHTRHTEGRLSSALCYQHTETAPIVNTRHVYTQASECECPSTVRHTVRLAVTSHNPPAAEPAHKPRGVGVYAAGAHCSAGFVVPRLAA
jgi:hypothetical protein